MRIMAVSVLLCAAGVGCGESAATPEGTAEDIVDIRAGEFRGVTLGSSRHQVLRRFGRPLGKPDEGLEPVGVSWEEAGFPFTISPPRRPTPSYHPRIVSMRYRDAGFLLERRVGVYAIAITADTAETAEGIGIGSTRGEIKKRYPRLVCGKAHARAEAAPRPFCSGRVAKGVHVWFGEDPVRSILFATTTFL